MQARVASSTVFKESNRRNNLEDNCRLGIGFYQKLSKKSINSRDGSAMKTWTMKPTRPRPAISKRLDSDRTVSVGDIAELYDFPFDKFQRTSIEAFLKGSSLVVCAPTSSGKTLVAEAAAATTIARGKRLFYTTPLKALSNQKLRDFRELFGEENVGLLTGDVAVNKEAPILIMTMEILRNMLYQSDGSLENVDVVVLDEVHYLSDISRGTVWEETIIYCPKEVQIICLSATVSNPEELASWITQVHGPTELVTSSKRPVPLVWHFSTSRALHPLLNEQGNDVNRNIENKDGMYIPRWIRDLEDPKEEAKYIRRKQVPQIMDTLRQLREHDMLPAIWFMFSRKGCDKAVPRLADVQLLTSKEQGQVKKALADFKKQRPDSVREMAVKALLRGVAAHHAGCLPTWKCFIEDLFQRGLIKVVCATETLAAGINMPARTTVISSLNKRHGKGLHDLLSSNAMLQMAGRAGRRGIDTQGHTVVVQTSFESAEDCFKLLLKGPDRLISQFTATYGMAINLLAVGRTLDDARVLIEHSFANYVGNNVMLAAKQRLYQLQTDIDTLEQECAFESQTLEGRLTRGEAQEFLCLAEELQEAKRLLLDGQKNVEKIRMATIQPLLDAAINGNPLFVYLSFFEHSGSKERHVHALFVGHVPCPAFVSDLVNLPSKLGKLRDDSFEDDVHHYLALGSDDCWYMFTAKSVKSVHKNPVNFGHEKSLDASLREKLQANDPKWGNLGTSGSGPLSCVWCANAMDTWAWSCQVPELSDLPDPLKVSWALDKAERVVLGQQNEVSKKKKKLTETQGYQLVDLQRARLDKLQHMKIKADRISIYISEMQPAGWNEFLQILKALRDSGAFKPESNELLALGQVAASVRGVNELWLAIVIKKGNLNSLKPAQLAAACACLVSDGFKSLAAGLRSSTYDASKDVDEWAWAMEAERLRLLRVQAEHAIDIPVEVSTEFAGLAEAWAGGVSWKELMEKCEMDEGDVARLLRRSIDLLAQIPHLPHIDATLSSTAWEASKLMDRPPISELLA